ncbi:MAG TPA: V-type ATPase subunit [Nitrospirota bacterium]|nr:V-type ATPase subunit [Nitrospirota bacterium]
MDLLYSPGEPGYPAEYLVSRIKGRRSALIKNWNQLVYDQDLFLSAAPLQPGGFRTSVAPDRIWADLMQEYRWVYKQMNQQLRTIFHPYFLYAELRTICICLRHLRDKKEGAIDEVLNKSLLSHEAKTVFVRSNDLAEAIIGVERLFNSLSKKFTGFSAIAEKDGLRGIEQRLTETYLAVMVESKLHPLLQMFFSRLIDARNIISIYKYLRLDNEQLPPVLPGGSIAKKKLRKISATDNIVEVGPMIRALTGIKVERPEPTMVELALYKGMTRWLRMEGREPLGAGPILDYLWRCSIEAMNLSVLYQGKDLERDLVAAELVM